MTCLRLSVKPFILGSVQVPGDSISAGLSMSTKAGKHRAGVTDTGADYPVAIAINHSGTQLIHL